jgi:putative ATP-binding cassette transporter
VRVIRWLLNESILRFSLATFASMAGGLLTIGVLILLFRLVGKSEEVRLEVFVVLSAGAVGSRLLARKLIETIGRDAILFLRVELFRRILAAALADIERIGRSRLMMALTEDIGRIASIVPSIVVLCTDVTLILACLAYLGWLSIGQLGIALAVVAVAHVCAEFRETSYNEVLLELRVRGKPMIVISHDDRYFQLADKTLVLERAKLPIQRLAGIPSVEQCV